MLTPSDILVTLTGRNFLNYFTSSRDTNLKVHEDVFTKITADTDSHGDGQQHNPIGCAT
jgi:hypothetical protein